MRARDFKITTIAISYASSGWISVVVFAFLMSCKSDNRQITSDLIHFPGENSEIAEDVPVIEFDSTTCRFGTIAIGEKYAHTFRFRNTGDSPLIISQVNPSCGCTVPKDWPHDPISPGETGEITVEFNSAGNSGKIDKVISVLTNCIPKVWDLRMQGIVSGMESESESTQPIDMEFKRPQ